MRALVRIVIYFQRLVSRKANLVLRGRVTRYETSTGTYFLPNDAPDDIIVNTIKADGIFDEEIVAVVKNYIGEGSTILDVGSNVGQMTVIFSRAVGLTGRVYSFEAQPFIFGLLEKNIRANGCDNVTAISKAVYDHDELLVTFSEPRFWRFASYGSYGLMPKKALGRKVSTITIDSLRIEGRIDFMKIDIQGADIHALRGAKNTIIKQKMPILFEFEERFQKDFQTSFDEYMIFIEEINYKIEKTINDINYLIVPR